MVCRRLVDRSSRPGRVAQDAKKNKPASRRPGVHNMPLAPALLPTTGMVGGVKRDSTAGRVWSPPVLAGNARRETQTHACL